jgi:tRNA pseudouridine38-40 synthase
VPSDEKPCVKTRKIKLVIGYEGTNYRGWQRQDNAPTVQETIEQALASIIGRSVTVRGASRTDSGVHAEGQVAHFLVESPIPDSSFAVILNDRLPADIVIASSQEVPVGFDSSRDAIKKTYRYRIYTGWLKDVEHFRRRWQYEHRLDVSAMNRAAALLLGTHDFRAFASAKDTRDNFVRTVFAAHAYQAAEYELDFEITADRFLYHMVRNIVGTIVEIGRGHWPVEKMAATLARRDRTQAGPTAPGHGLCLLNIEYPDNSENIASAT